MSVNSYGENHQAKIMEVKLKLICSMFLLMMIGCTNTAPDLTEEVDVLNSRVEDLEEIIINMSDQIEQIVDGRDDNNWEFLEDEVTDLKDDFDDYQSCMSLWSIGNEFMMGDDVYLCSN